LSNASYLENNIQIKGQEQGVVICPGPNMAYFDKEISLSEMVQHIYGNTNVLSSTERPNMFVKELKMYVAYLTNEINDVSQDVSLTQTKKWNAFKSNLSDGIDYYKMLFAETYKDSETNLLSIQKQLQKIKTELAAIAIPSLVTA
jgi:hypothetical protein